MPKYYIQIPAVSFYVPAFLDHLAVAVLLRYRKRCYGFTFRKIKLTQGKYAIVDPEDYEKLIGYPWYAAKSPRTFYARRYENGKTIKMHRQIMNPPPGLFVDHENHNGLDNRKANLKIATPTENARNRRPKSGKSGSIYKGVRRNKKLNKWRAVICYNGKYIHLGYFDDEKQAAKAYDEAAKELFGRFAFLNFPDESLIQK
jgi:hypothetical protein